jgi:hypothetical protein
MGWLKVCLICVQLMSDDEKAPRRGPKTLCSAIAQADWTRIARISKMSDSQAVCKELDTHILKIMQTYTKQALISEIAEATRMRELCAFMVRCGEQLLHYSRRRDASKSDTDSVEGIDLAELERELRQNLNMSPSCNVKAVVAKAAQESGEPADKKARLVVPDNTGSVAFDSDGKTRATHILTARQAGLCVDVRVQTTKKLRGIISGALGTIKQVGNPDIFVQFNKGSLETGADKDAEHDPVWMTRASLQVYEPPKFSATEKKKQKADAEAQAAAKLAALPAGVAWQGRTKEQALLALTNQVRTSLYQLYVSKLPYPNYVRFLPERGAVASQDG